MYREIFKHYKYENDRKTYGNTARFKTDRGYNVYPIGIGQNGDDIYIGVFEKKGDYIFGDVVLYKKSRVFQKRPCHEFYLFPRSR